MRKIVIHEDDAIDEPLVNLTPLIDVVFVVLITFMLIAPVLDIDSVDLATSGSKKQKGIASIADHRLTIAVHADNTIWIQGKQLALSDLSKYVNAEKKRNPGQIPQVVHDKTAQFGTYQSVKNALEAAGFEQMDIVLKP